MLEIKKKPRLIVKRKWKIGGTWLVPFHSTPLAGYMNKNNTSKDIVVDFVDTIICQIIIKLQTNVVEIHAAALVLASKKARKTTKVWAGLGDVPLPAAWREQTTLAPSYIHIHVFAVCLFGVFGVFFLSWNSGQAHNLLDYKTSTHCTWISCTLIVMCQ